MANTYSQLYVHLVFAVKRNHLSLIQEENRITMEKYINGIISKRVYNYIQNQKEHHKKYTFREEYLDMLEKAKIEYDPQYLFDFF
jgi:hypothetical protein